MADHSPANAVSNADIKAVRRFNRFHTDLVGALNERLLASDYSLSQVRILYEIATARAGAAPSAREIGDALRMDAGYFSRLISGLESEGLIHRTPSARNAKRLDLTLTAKGEKVFCDLNAASAAEVAALLAPLSKADRERLIRSMGRISRALGGVPADPGFALRAPRSGDLGLIVHGQGALYAEEYGWDWTFEALVAEIVGAFVKGFIPEKERCWVAEMEGEVVGSVFVVRQDDETAKLRMLYVDAQARGLGLGRRLVQECIRFAQAKGYRRMVLWTNDVLVSARRIYQAEGFALMEEAAHHSFGKDLIGQVWGRDL